MRLIYLLRVVQLLMTLRAFWMLYSVSEFCERTHQGMPQCLTLPTHIRDATPEEIAALIERRKLRLATMLNDTDSAISLLFNLTTIDVNSTTFEIENEINSTVASSTEAIKKRDKREEAKVLPGNGLTEGERKAVKTVEAVKVLEAIKEEEKTEVVNDTTTDHPVDRTGENTLIPLEYLEHLAKEIRPFPDPTEATAAPKTEKNKEYLGAKVEIPAASEANSSDTSESIPDKHHTVKKDLKAHFLVPAKIEKKEVRVPKLAPAQETLVHEPTSDAFLQETRCVEVTFEDAFLGKQSSPFAEHLKGFVWVGPLLVVVCVYLVGTVVMTKIGSDDPTEYIHFLGCIFHSAMWMIVGLSMYYLHSRWIDNWTTSSANTFLPDFPSAWNNLIFISSFMMVATSLETWFYKRLFDNLVLERSYRCYEVIDNTDVAQNRGHYSSRTNVY